MGAMVISQKEVCGAELPATLPVGGARTAPSGVAWDRRAGKDRRVGAGRRAHLGLGLAAIVPASTLG